MISAFQPSHERDSGHAERAQMQSELWPGVKNAEGSLVEEANQAYCHESYRDNQQSDRQVFPVEFHFELSLSIFDCSPILLQLELTGSLEASETPSMPHFAGGASGRRIFTQSQH